MLRLSLVILSLFLVVNAQASHLSDDEVAAMERACDEARQSRLDPQRLVLIEKCMHEQGKSQAACEKQAANYGEIKTGGIRTLGKYYDLPVCEEAYRARKHYKMNPGR